MNFFFFLPWLAFSIIVLVWGAVFFIWGKKSGQFSRQDRARYLPLWAHVPEREDKKKTESREAD
jgi:cbb3-type cytochrome oxidase maturation protein